MCKKKRERYMGAEASGKRQADLDRMDGVSQEDGVVGVMELWAAVGEGREFEDGARGKSLLCMCVCGRIRNFERRKIGRMDMHEVRFLPFTNAYTPPCTYLKVFLLDNVHKLGKRRSEELSRTFLVFDGGDDGGIGPKEHDADVDAFFGG